MLVLWCPYPSPPHPSLCSYTELWCSYKLGHICSKHGGLLINLNDVFTYDIRTLYEYSYTWEVYLLTFQDLVSIDLLISAIYRPPHDDNNDNGNISKFIAEFSPIIDILQKENKSAAIVGDFDINLLQINNPRKSEFFGMMRTNNFVPKITLPTCYRTHSCSLIDQNFLQGST